MPKTPLLLVTLLITLFFSASRLPAASGVAKTRLEKVRQDRKKVEADGYWIYNDFNKGLAQAKKLNNDPKLVYSLHGDGELQEGQNWEAIMYASGKKIDNLIATIDLNGKQIDGATDDVLPMGDIKAKFEAFDWDVLEIKEGNNIEAILKGMQEAKTRTGKGKPVCVLLHTIMGNGGDFMMHTHAWHGKAPNDEQLESALGQNAATLGDY
jgi:transketolase